MKKFMYGFLGIFCLGMVLVSCSKDEETATEENTANLTQEIPQAVIDAAGILELNTNFIKYDTFYYPDGTSEERLFFEYRSQIAEKTSSVCSKPIENYETLQTCNVNINAHPKLHKQIILFCLHSRAASNPQPIVALMALFY